MDEKSCDLSPRALVQDVEGDIIAFIPVVKSSWGGGAISLLLEPDDSTDPPFLSSLMSQTRKRIIVAYQYNLSITEIVRVTHTTESGKSRWELSVKEQAAEFTPSIEMGLGGTSVDELAEKRARRLLLNENPSKESRDLNEITRELFIQGMGSVLRVEKSPFPTIYQHYRSSPQRFVEIAWILAVTQLKLSAAIAQVEKLRLLLTEDALQVDFVGRRRKQYANAPAYIMRIHGICPLIV